jgi:uncharacterized membrane protein
MTRLKILSAALLFLGLVGSGAAWAMAISALWPIVLLLSISLFFLGAALGFSIVTQIAYDRDVERTKLLRRLQEPT